MFPHVSKNIRHMLTTLEKMLFYELSEDHQLMKKCKDVFSWQTSMEWFCSIKHCVWRAKTAFRQSADEMCGQVQSHESEG